MTHASIAAGDDGAARERRILHDGPRPRDAAPRDRQLQHVGRQRHDALARGRAGTPQPGRRQTDKLQNTLVTRQRKRSAKIGTRVYAACFRRMKMLGVIITDHAQVIVDEALLPHARADALLEALLHRNNAELDKFCWR